MRGPRFIAIAGGLLLIGYALFLHHHTVFSVGGSDSSGYVNSARLLASGRVTEPIRGLRELGLSAEFTRVFVPLGYVPAAKPGDMAPSYPPGLPAHMALAALLGGWERAPFFVNPIAALACLVLLYFLGRELRLPRLLALAGPALLACSPAFVFLAVQPMSDVLATAWALAAVFCAYRAGRSRPALWSAGAGVAFAVGVLVRPTNLLVLLPVVIALPLRAKTWLSFAFAGAPFALLLVGYNRAAFGDATTSGYGAILSGGMAWENFPARARHYSYWLIRLSSPLLPLGWAALTADRRAPARDRAILLSWFGAFFLFYSFYGPYDAWWYTRFLLPGLPAMILGALVVARDLFFDGERQRAPRAAVAAATLLIALAGAAGVWFIQRGSVHKIYKGERIYPRACAAAERRVPPDGIVLSMQMSGALHYYTGLTYAMWNWLEVDQFALLRTSTESRGRRWFALLAPFEVEEVRKLHSAGWREIDRTADIALWELDPAHAGDQEFAGAARESVRVPMKMRKSASISPLSVNRCSASQSRESTMSSHGSPARKLLTIPKSRGFRRPPP